MTQWGFYKRRLIRLQPMIVIGSVIGAALLWFQDYSIYPKLHAASTWQVLLIMLVGFTMIPLPKSVDIRGWDENYPLNGPAWSLFYEYVANILYAAGVRKLSNRGLSILVALGAFALIYLAVFGVRGDLVGGWTLDRSGIQFGMSRVMFPFFAGVLLMRLGNRIRVKNSLALCSCLLVIALSIPRVGGTEHLWINGAYESVCVVLLFPLIVAIGAGEKREDGASIQIARFFGDLSYPLYITHYPLIYIYTGWAIDNHVSALEGAVVGAGVFVASVALAYACLKLYDIPARRMLSRWLLERRSERKVASAS